MTITFLLLTLMIWRTCKKRKRRLEAKNQEYKCMSHKVHLFNPLFYVLLTNAMQFPSTYRWQCHRLVLEYFLTFAVPTCLVIWALSEIRSDKCYNLLWPTSGLSSEFLNARNLSTNILKRSCCAFLRPIWPESVKITFTTSWSKHFVGITTSA